MTVLAIVGSFILPASPAFAAWGNITVTHVPPAIAYAGEDLAVSFTATHACVVGSFCPSDFTVELHYLTPWGTEGVVADDFNTYTAQSQAGQLVVPGRAVRAIYNTLTAVPTFSYWFVGHWSAADCDPSSSPCNESYRSPSANNHSVTVVHRVDLEVLTPTGSAPVANMEWSFAYYPAGASTAPVVVSSGHTPSNGKITFNVALTPGMFNAVDDAANGFLNVFVQGWCVWTVVIQQCVDTDSTVERTIGEAEDVYTFLYSAVMNVKNTAYEAAVSGIGTAGTVTERQVKVTKYDSSGDFKPQYAECDGDQSCNTGNDQSSTTPGACPWDGYGIDQVYDRWSAIQEGHTDYGSQTRYYYGRSSDSTWTVGFRGGSGNAWSVSGASQLSGKTSQVQDSATPPNISGSGWTRQRWGARVRYALYVSQATYYKEGRTNQAYCDRAWWVHAIKRLTPDDDPGTYTVNLGWYGERDNGSATNTPTPTNLAQTNDPSARMRDRCFGSCTSGGVFHFVSNAWDTGFDTKTEKSEFVQIGGCLWDFCGGYSSGWSQLSRLHWSTGGSIRSCSNGWKFYYDGVKNPAGDPGTPNVFIDAGDNGPGHHTSQGGGSIIPDGC